MVLEKGRWVSERLLGPVAKRCKGFSPHSFSIAALVCALAAGYFFYISHRCYEFLFVGALFVFLNGLLDALDGCVAKHQGKGSRRGDLLDHAIDRYADFAILTGLVLSPYITHILIGLLALMGVFMTSYMGTQAQAVGAARDYSGVLGRADRLVLLIAIPAITGALVHLHAPYQLTLPWLGTLTLLDIMMLWFAVAGNLTALHRGARAWRSLP
ncbi:MAG: CDP-alcohol phosphatidyltransferase family protein [Candidatus Thermoplasmatota archaeon]